MNRELLTKWRDELSSYISLAEISWDGVDELIAAIDAELAKPEMKLVADGTSLDGGKTWLRIYAYASKDACEAALAPPSESEAVALLREMRESEHCCMDWHKEIDAILKGKP